MASLNAQRLGLFFLFFFFIRTSGKDQSRRRFPLSIRFLEINFRRDE